MNLPIPAPVTIFEKSYSVLDMARHITGKERRYNRTADDARAGVRLVAALEKAGTGAADIDELDLRKFAQVLEAPSCGWGAHEVSVQWRDPRDGKTQTQTRQAAASTSFYLPLIDPITAAVKALPPLAK